MSNEQLKRENEELKETVKTLGQALRNSNNKFADIHAQLVVIAQYERSRFFRIYKTAIEMWRKLLKKVKDLLHVR